MRRTFRVGLIAILLGVALATTAWFLSGPPSVRYAGSQGRVAATVALRTGGTAPPAQVTIDLGGGIRIVAARLP